MMKYENLWKMITISFCVTNLLILFKLYNTFTKVMFKSIQRLEGKVIIITGANSGIGRVTAMNLAERGAKVILACRDLNKAEEARDEIVKISGNENVVVRHLDLCSLSSVRNFATNIISTEDRLDVLINNAGLGGITDTKTEDGIELGLQVNHYGHFLLTNLLIDLLKASAPSRIIHVSSVLHRIGRLDFNNMERGIPFFNDTLTGLMIYSDSKLFNVIGSIEFARRLKRYGVTSNSLHPGIVRTEVFRHAPMRYFINKMLEIFFKTAEEGAQTTIFLAVSNDVTEVSGKYFVGCKEASAAPITHDPEIGKKFWERCCDIVRLKPEERII